MSQIPTPSERYLEALARRTFLRLWTHPSPFLFEGGTTKELCDLLVIFGDDVFIFSDKDCALDMRTNPALAWKRWYDKAVLRSAEQVAGAQRMLQRRVPLFLDSKRTRPMELPLPSQPRFHRILTVRGAVEATASEWGGRGSLIVTNRHLNACRESQFRLGATDDAGSVYHVFDPNGLDAVLATLDTLADFKDYLVKREALMRRDQEVTGSSEEDLLGLFLMSFDESTNSHEFAASQEPYALVDNSHWQAWCDSRQRRARDAANEVSYVWDEFIEKFTDHIQSQTLEHSTSAEFTDIERLMRLFAAENRLKRRIFGESLVQMAQTTPVGAVRRRYFRSDAEQDRFWVFLAAPKPPDVDYDKYRLHRRQHLIECCLVVKHLYPEARTIIGFAFGDVDGHFTEDATSVDVSDWDEEAAVEARYLHEVRGIFSNVNHLDATTYNYPI